jgi:hypothetical protein
MIPARAAGSLRGDRANDHLVHVAPDPVFAGFNGTHDGMAAIVKMFGGVFVFGRIAAADVPAHHAHAEMNPSVAHLDALFTDARAGFRNLGLLQMLALL